MFPHFHSNFPVAMYYVSEILALIFCTFIPNNVEGSKRTTTHISYFDSSTKKKSSKKTKKRYNFMIASL